VIRAIDDTGLAPYRAAFAHALVGAVVVDQALDRQALVPIRGRIDAADFVPYRRLHHGSFERLRPVREPELIAAVVAIAEAVTGASLALMANECLRLRHGDYVLASEATADAGDPGPTSLASRWIEVTADLSSGSSGEAQVVYARRGEHFFAAPQLSGSVAIVERQPTIARYDRYLNHRVADRVVHRLRLQLARSSVTATEPPPKMR
jgi:hypothetical protein